MFCPHERDVILIKALACPASLEQFFCVFANNKNDLFKIGSLPPSLRKKKQTHSFCCDTRAGGWLPSEPEGVCIALLKPDQLLNTRFVPKAMAHFLGWCVQSDLESSIALHQVIISLSPSVQHLKTSALVP